MAPARAMHFHACAVTAGCMVVCVALCVSPCVLHSLGGPGLLSVDFMIVDQFVLPAEGEPSASRCWHHMPELRGRGGVNVQATEGVVYLPLVYQANTYHLHMVGNGTK